MDECPGPGPGPGCSLFLKLGALGLHDLATGLDEDGFHHSSLRMEVRLDKGQLDNGLALYGFLVHCLLPLCQREAHVLQHIRFEEYCGKPFS